MDGRARVKISVKVNPYILDGVEAYIREHPDPDLQTVVDEALEVWLQVATEQDRAIEEQYAAPDDRPEHEVKQWERIRDASARMMFSRDPN